MTDKPFDPTKPVQTRDGRKARIICTDMKNSYSPIVVLIAETENSESLTARAADGRCSNFTLAYGDLVNVPTKRKAWINIYPVGPYRHPDKELADLNAAPSRLDCIEIEWEE